MASRWRTGLEESVCRGYDDQTVFERFCRQKGTRINWIMAKLEKGWSDEDIAAQTGTSAKVISVYRKALNGTLCTLESSHGSQAEAYDKITMTYMLVGSMRYIGRTIRLSA